MSQIHEFADLVVRGLEQLQASHTRELIKGEATKHDRLCGRILAYGEIQALIKETAKRWSLRDHAQEDTDV